MCLQIASLRIFTQVKTPCTHAHTRALHCGITCGLARCLITNSYQSRSEELFFAGGADCSGRKYAFFSEMVAQRRCGRCLSMDGGDLRRQSKHTERHRHTTRVSGVGSCALSVCACLSTRTDNKRDGCALVLVAAEEEREGEHSRRTKRSKHKYPKTQV